MTENFPEPFRVPFKNRLFSVTFRKSFITNLLINIDISVQKCYYTYNEFLQKNIDRSVLSYLHIEGGIMFNSKKTKIVSDGMINTIIGDNSKIEGLLVTSDSTRVDGLLQGKILSESSVIIGEHGVIRGDIKAVDILIAGTVYGNIKADSKIELTGTGRVLGDMFTKTLVIDEGASFKGNCTMDLSEEENSSYGSIPDMEEEPAEFESSPQPSAIAAKEAAVTDDNTRDEQDSE